MSSAEVFIVSGGIGASGEQLARTALAQFAEVEVQVNTLPGVRSDDALCRAVERAAAAGGIITDRRKVIGLTLEPERLVEYRRERQQRLGPAASTRYSELREIARDLEFADELFRRRRFATIDVTSRPVEETASDVVALVGGQRQFAD